MTKPEQYCNHPSLLPTQWEQKRPERALMTGCDCGQNMRCPVCGWGYGAYPCKCTKPDPGVRIMVNYQANDKVDYSSSQVNDKVNYTKEQAT